MRSRIPGIVILTVLVFATSPLAQSADSGRGRQLHDSFCISCHTTSVYTRDDRLARSYAELREQVARWRSNLGLPWHQTDIEDVASYLNEAFYQFECPTQEC